MKLWVKGGIIYMFAQVQYIYICNVGDAAAQLLLFNSMLPATVAKAQSLSVS